MPPLSDQTFLSEAAIWGQVFEIAVQRGVLAHLLHQGILPPDHDGLKPWRENRISIVTQRVIKGLAITDDNAIAWVESAIRHLLVFGYGLGWTTMREYLKHTRATTKENLTLKAIWCPLTLPGEDTSKPVFWAKQEETAIAFHRAFNMKGAVDLDIVHQGYPGKADFLLWLRGNDRNKPQDRLLCLEFSYNALPGLADFRTEAPHCNEVNRYARYLEARGVFSRVCAEVAGENFALSDHIKNHLRVFSGKDKPLYKLCQAASYLDQLVGLLQNIERLPSQCEARAIAVTSNGLESLMAHFGERGDPRVALMQSLGEAYRRLPKDQDPSPENFDAQIAQVFRQLQRSLPKKLRSEGVLADGSPFPLKKLPDHLPALGQDFHFTLQEEVTQFHNPTTLMAVEKAIAQIEITDSLQAWFGGDPLPHFRQALNDRRPDQGRLNLRDVHGAAVVAGLQAAQRGRVNVIALEGNPGIGKTTAVVRYLEQQTQGYGFFYLSPRVVINREVTQTLARDRNDQPKNILTLTTNSELIKAAPHWYTQQHPEMTSPGIDGAIVVDGVPNLHKPATSTMFISPKEEQEIEIKVIASDRYKCSLNEREDAMRTNASPGVLRTLAKGTRDLFVHNPRVNRFAITAAIQGYRTLADRTTVEALSKLFRHAAHTKAGGQERRTFGDRIPQIIVMVDEVAGDGAGALFCHEIARWLHREFIEPFEGGICPFQVVLIIADASLGNEVVLNSYLNGGDRAPDKVLISPTQGDAAFRVTATKMRIGNRKAQPTLHIMTNSYPASQLHIDYSVHLTTVTPEEDSNGRPQSIRRAIRDRAADMQLNHAQAEIKRGLDRGAKQIIFFAQDKAFLRQLHTHLTMGGETTPPLLKRDEVRVIDQNVPTKNRMEYLQPRHRDRIRVFLLTSSGSRGVSFPKTDWIIAAIPRFNIEASLMEVAQLIYRGRGTYTDQDQTISSDTQPKRLVMLMDDFVIQDNEHEDKQDRRPWLRQCSDLLTLLVMLRSTIYTRITGDAGLDHQAIAFVPVGAVGAEQLLNFLSQDLRDFLREAQVFVCDAEDSELKGLVQRAALLTEALFGQFTLKGRSPELAKISYTFHNTVANLSRAIARPSDRLLAIPSQDPALVMPENISCFGPFWLENWQGRDVEEGFRFDTYREALYQATGELLGLLTGIAEQTTLPPELRKLAKNLKLLLVRDKEKRMREYSTLQEMNTDDVTIALPLDYPHFLSPSGGEAHRQQVLEEPDTWRNALGRSLIAQGTVIPAIAKYETFPWAAVVGGRTLNQGDLLFDDRYFMASSELNLLNLLLLEKIPKEQIP